jgi:hypothetical protein
MQALAKTKGGKCLSKKYINGKNKLKWQCGKGHQWKTTSMCVFSGNWCPTCSYPRVKKKHV